MCVCERERETERERVKEGVRVREGEEKIDMMKATYLSMPIIIIFK